MMCCHLLRNSSRATSSAWPDGPLTEPRRLSFEDWLALATAGKEWLLAPIRFAIVPTGRIVNRLKDVPQGAADAASPCNAARVSWAINAVAARVPWRADCLLRAMAADRRLRCGGERPQFSLGVAKDGVALRAHAWLRCHGVTVTGGEVSEYTEIIAPWGPLVGAERGSTSDQNVRRRSHT
jgi:hypothetical protein